MPFPETRPSILIRLRDRTDSEAWAVFESLYAGVIAAVARNWGLQPADADDITQDVMTRVARSADRIDAQHRTAAFRTLLNRMIRQSLVDRHRREQRRSVTHLPTGRVLQLENAAVDEASAQVDATIDLEYRREVFRWAARHVQAEFRSQSWLAFEATSMHGRSVQEVSKELEMSVGAIYTARSRILNRLREKVLEFDPEFEPVADDEALAREADV